MELTEIILTAEDYGTSERNLLLTEEGYRRRYMLAEGEESGIGSTGWTCTEAGTGVSRRIKYCRSAGELYGFLTGRYNSAGREFWLDRNGSSLQCLYAAGKALYMEYGQKGEWSTYMQGKTEKHTQPAARCRHLPACAGREDFERYYPKLLMTAGGDGYSESTYGRLVPKACPQEEGGPIMAGTVEPVRVLAAYRKLMDLYGGDKAAEDILSGMASEILDISPDRLLEILHEHRDEIKIISGEAE